MSADPTRWTAAEAAALLAPPGPDSDKYLRGVLAARTGSTAYPGAAVLTVEAAWRTGVGMVRFVPGLDDAPPAFGLPTPAAAVVGARPETVITESGTAEATGADAWLLGSGTDARTRSLAEREALARLLAGRAPLVIDAGALPELSRGTAARAPRAITPHLGEFLALWAAHDLGALPADWPTASAPSGTRAHPSEAARRSAALQLARRLDATVLLKGSLTIVATPGGLCTTVGPATPWLATAGTGDVLAGILGALAATHAAQIQEDPEHFGPVAATAAVIHDLAARRACGEPAAPITAGDVARAIPEAIASLQE